MFRPGREPLEVEVFRVVNVGEHPDLRAPALSGELHTLDDGETVGVPFIYHDPDAFQFILVVPDGAEGRELSERARLLESLMIEPAEAVPSYVRHFSVAHGHDGLAERVDGRWAMEIDAAELEPVDREPAPADYFPRLASVLPPSTFVDHLDTDLAILSDDGELWLFARLPEASMQSFNEETTELRLQLKVVDQAQVCVLSLLDGALGTRRRAFLNPDRAVDGPVLEALACEFQANVILTDDEGRMVRSFRVEAPCAQNARLVLERTDRMPTVTAERWGAAVETVRAMGAAALEEPHPFTLGQGPVNAAEALVRLELLERWSTPARIDHAILQLGVPHSTVELSRRTILADAARHGLAMSETLLNDAVAFGLASDASSLVERLRSSFDETLATASVQWLDEAAIESNRASLERLESLHGTSTGPNRSCTMEHSG